MHRPQWARGIVARVGRSGPNTVTLLVPVRRMISLVPTPSAVSNTIRARQACFCRLLLAPHPGEDTWDSYVRFYPLADLARPLAQLIAIFRGIVSFAFFSVKVKTPSSSWAVICCWSILSDSVNARAKWPTLYSVY